MSPGQQQEVERKVLKLAMRSVPKLPQVNEVDKNGTEPGQVKSEESNSDKILNQENSESFGGDGNNKKLTMKDLQLSDAELNRALGTRSNDYLENVEEGSQTLLNTKQWRYASFFNRVKRQVAQNWHPDVAYQRRDPDGNVYGFKDRLTVLRVQLTPQGRLKALAVEKPCGIDFLDEEAESAFRASEPFPNPPPGLVDKESGMITFRFGFLFEFSRRPGFRMFKYNN
jgi:TonB family protein